MTIDWQMVGALAAIVSVLVAIIGIIIAVIIARSQRSKTPGTGRRKNRARSAIRFCRKCVTTVSMWCIRRIRGIRQTSVAICRKKKRRFQIRWTIWRKKMKVSILNIIDRDNELKAESVSEGERIGVAAILLSEHLIDDGNVVPEDDASGESLHVSVFRAVRDNHPKKFKLLCARIAKDLVTNLDLRVDRSGVYVLPWDPILESFLKEALDDPPLEPLGTDQNEPLI